MSSGVEIISGGKMYINFYFKNLIQDGDWVTGRFESPDKNVYCDFIYNIKTKEYEISNCSMPEEEILPLPLYWLEIKLEQNGSLKSQESKISY